MAAPLPGQIVVDSLHPAWFRYQGGGSFFMCGPGDPEGFLYRGTRNANGTRTGDQADLIDRLSTTGANCIYLMAIRSHGGDGDATQNPFINSDPTQSLNTAIVNQWETWFTAMDQNNIVVFFIFYDDSASPFGKELPAGGQLKAAEAAFIDAMVSRFKHHLHLVWCVAEEYAEGLSFAHAARCAERIRQQDDQQHPITIHQNNSTSFDFNGNANLDGFAVQWNVNTAAELHAGALAARANVGDRININVSEFANPGTGTVLRQKLWAIALGGAYSMVLGMDIAATPIEDLQACGRVVRFMESTHFEQAAPHDELAAGNTDYVLADPGNVYLAYADAGAQLGVSTLAGRYHVRWYDPLNGAWVDAGRVLLPGGVSMFTKPAAFGNESALSLELIRPPGQAQDPLPFNGSTGVGLNTSLSWTAGSDTLTHDVYFGTTSPGAYRGNQATVTFQPGPLLANTTYYWRVDEKNEAGTTTGNVWSFHTAPVDADADGDGDVDQEDFGRLQVCFSKLGTLLVPPECVPADLNHDNVVDQADLVVFLRCMSGANVPADPGCSGP